VHVLGPLRLEGADLTSLRSRQARTVLKVLAVAGGDVVTADALVDAVWPAGLPADPDRDVAVLVSRVRALLGAERIVRSDAGYQLIADWYDRHEVEALTREAAARESIGDVAAARSTAEAALALAPGELLAGEPDADWVKVARSEAARTIAVARSVAARTALAAGLPVEALRYGEWALDRDPYDEAALRVVVAAHVAAGRPGSALAEYAAMRTRLAEDLGVNPSAAMSAAAAAGRCDRP
jgi:DNA-binding SARP family transcriptional activator